MPIAALSLLIQVLFTVHALKTGRDRSWAYIIMFIPGVGALAYFVVELLPEMLYGRTGAQAKKMGAEISRKLNPDKHLRRLEEDLAATDSLANRKKLASAYLSSGRPKEALELYAQCLGGIYRDDSDLMLEVAQAHFMVGDYEKSSEFLAGIKGGTMEKRRLEKEFLLARIADETGREKEALDRWSGLVNVWPGEEARCRLAYYLGKNGSSEKAHALYKEILLNARRSPGYYRKSEKAWIEIAKGELAKVNNEKQCETGRR
ncbi:MAG: hypothetical protein HZB23_07935 [Deltaproteobacteria bacterium]|nr:hypothetical protein [Deltaproteobacteria bacterium]